MRSTVWTVLMALLLVGFAGCTGDSTDEGENDPTATTEPTGTMEPTGTQEPGTTTTAAPTTTGAPTTNGTQSGGENAAPVPSLGASSEGGAIPFNVNFTLNATDPDGDELSWTLDVDGDMAPETEGVTLPFNYTFSYATEGLYNVTFTVTDGTNTVNETLVINATAASGASDQFSGSFIGGPVGCALRPTAPGGDLDGLAYTTHVLNPATIGQPFSLIITPLADAAFDMYMVAEDGSIIASDSTGLGAAGSYEITGVVPESAHFVAVRSCGPGGDVDYTV